MIRQRQAKKLQLNTQIFDLFTENHNGNHVVLHPSDSPVTAVATRPCSGRHHHHGHPAHAVAYLSTHIFVQSR